MHCRPRALVRHARRHKAVLGLALLCVGACTDPSFLNDTDAVVESPGSAVDPSEKDVRDDPSNVVDTGADAATRDSAEACDACALDAGDASHDASGQPAPDGQAAAVDARVEPADAQPQSPDTLDPARRGWVGRYATRSYVFGRSGVYETFGKYLTLAQIKPTPDGGLVLEEEICRFESSFSLLITARFSVDYPPGTRLTAPLEFDAETFSSASATASVGYGPAPTDCAGAATSRSASPVRNWLTDNECECPRDPNVMPTSAKDCRVIDADGDGFPGNTFRTSLAGLAGVARVTQAQKLRLLNGYRVGERLYAQREFSDVTNVLSCTVDGAPKRIEECPLGTSGPCPPSFHKVELYPIAAQYGCSDILQREAGWFVSPQPEFPAGCPSRP